MILSEKICGNLRPVLDLVGYLSSHRRSFYHVAEITETEYSQHLREYAVRMRKRAKEIE